LLTATDQNGAETIGDRRERNIVDRDVELLAHLRHIRQTDPRRAVAPHVGDGSGQ
jgi:hypothetical protein